MGVTEQPEFRNAVVALDLPAGPDLDTGASALLIGLKRLDGAIRPAAAGEVGPA